MPPVIYRFCGKFQITPAWGGILSRSFREKEDRVNRTCYKLLLIRTLSITMTGIAWCAFAAGAAQGPYELDLKELRRPPVRRAKDKEPAGAREPGAATIKSGGESSSYTVRKGDHLFRILMQSYGLSNKAAEELIPKIMHLNGIRRPEGLSVGQRLTIPLPPITTAAAKAASESGREPPPSPPTESAAAPPYPAETHYERELSADQSRPCLLARDVAEQLGVHISGLPPFIEAEGASMSYDALKVTVACVHDPAEAYTLGRLLTPQGGKLLFFKADESPRSVIEGVAASLGFSFRLSSADTAAELPLIYLFPAAIAGKDLRLTIRPAVPAAK